MASSNLDKLVSQVTSLGIEKQSSETSEPPKTNEENNGTAPETQSSPKAADGQEEKTEKSTEEISAAEKSLLQKVLRKGLVESTKSVEVQRRDPNSPLYSVKTFEALNLKPELLKGIYQMGFNAPSKIQETALPTLLANPPQNMIAQSQSGTGKTAAFVLAMLSRVDTSKPYPQVLCLSPTYELAVQTGEVAAKMAKFCPDIKMKFALKGETLARGTRIEEHVLIGTPGKIMDWSIKFKFFDIKKITAFVLDEADIMIATQGHQDQCIRIHKMLSPSCQMMFFSATYDTEVMEFAELIVKNATIIRLQKEEESLENIKQYYVKCGNIEEKYQAITNIYGVITIGQAIIFCQTKKTACWLSDKMTQDGHSVAILSGDLTVEDRISVLDRFREGLEKVLITTNVLARGIDVEQVTIVVNFDLPVDQNQQADYETYLHRIGRTGRFGNSGVAINLVDSTRSMQICQDIERHFKRTIYHLDAEDPDAIEKIAA
ncbi:DEAD-box helicase Dbp80 [Nasonia vitripennis]|uniref:RNA helicase n=1 Tax=Nasonia vitripennis TaxID=7425 RepID=A0A7M7H5A1_NASVI|nr:DEAD-box helicase Dbp80 [Nasonia vitripennis]XP_008208908.1 DEAD-box helicase Dbp80 [Nasonia vitripennis]